jgi:hypothetical protein
MGQHQIVEKLRTEFQGEITSERQVVYILVEIGKLLEHEGAKGLLNNNMYNMRIQRVLSLGAGQECVVPFRV